MKIFNKKHLVLIVDDSPDNIRLLGEILGTEYQIIYATNGAEAVESTIAQRPDLILLDIMMPDMDGFEVCIKLKEDSRTSEIPIIFVTALDTVQHETVGLELGGIDYITKPINPNLVRLRVRNHLELKALQDHYKSLSSLDGLTGIANRRRFDEFLDQEWRRALRSGSVISLILMDIDSFKPFNDHYGHIAGDDCLKLIATVISKSLERATDLFARYGGEEFVCVLPGTDSDGALTIAEKLRQKVLSLKIPHSHSTTGVEYVTLSLGVAAIIPDKKIALQHLIKLADENLYKAKMQGRNRTVCST